MLSISVDTIYSHAVYAEKLGGISFPMLSDFHPKGKVTKLYGTYNEEYGRGFRSVFLIDSTGVIRYKKIYNPGLPDLNEVIAQLKEMA